MTAIRAIHAGCRALGFDEETRRDIYHRVTGKRSAGDMNERERQRVVEELRRLGFKTKSDRRPDGRAKLTGKYAPKLQALWIGAWNLGLVRERDDAALLKFIKRQAGVDHVRFLTHQDDADKAIGALKGWMTRAGVDWSVAAYQHGDWRRLSGARIALAQYAMIGMKSADGRVQWSMFSRAVFDLTGRVPGQLLEDRLWVPVMNAFGVQVRAAKGADQ